MKFSLTLKFVTVCLLLAHSFAMNGPSELITCDPGVPFPWKFLGKITASINDKNPTATFRHHCFQKTTVTWLGYNEAQNEVTVEFDAQDPISTTCSDSILIHNVFNFETKVRVFQGKSTLKFKIRKAREKTFIDNMGLKVVPMCDRWFNILPDIFMTLETFFLNFSSSWFTKEQYQALIDQNWKFMHRMWGRKIEERADSTPLSLEWCLNNIRSGDVYCDYGASGLGLLTTWGTGGQCSHTGIFLWGRGEDEGKLFMVESNTPIIRKKEFTQWFRPNNRVSRVLKRLSPENSKKFNVNKAWDAFDAQEGNPYGYETFLFSFLDTPNDNMPQVIDTESKPNSLTNP